MIPTILTTAYEAIDNKKGADIVILDMAGVSVMADYIIITHANSERQVQAIAREVADEASKEGIDVKRIEGLDAAKWVLVDLGDVVVHVFHNEERSYYNLERLWSDAPIIDLPHPAE